MASTRFIDKHSKNHQKLYNITLQTNKKIKIKIDKIFEDHGFKHLFDHTNIRIHKKYKQQYDFNSKGFLTRALNSNTQE